MARDSFHRHGGLFESFFLQIDVKLGVKVLLRSNYRFSFFLHFRVQYDFLTYLAKFQAITNIRSHSVLTFISENLRPPLLDHYLVANWRKWRHMSKNTSRVEIIITISIENWIKSNTNFEHVLRAIFYTYCYYNVNPWGIFAHTPNSQMTANLGRVSGQAWNRGVVG